MLEVTKENLVEEKLIEDGEGSYELIFESTISEIFLIRIIFVNKEEADKFKESI